MSLKAKVDAQSREVRAVASGLEVRSDDGAELVRVEGYAAIFNAEAVIGDYWREVIAPGAFAASLSEGRDVQLLVGHGGLPLARRSTGTLSVVEDDRGYVIPPERQLMAIASVEDALAGLGDAPAVYYLTRKGGPGYARLASAWAVALRHGGADVTPEGIYLRLHEDLSDGKPAIVAEAQAAILQLLSLVSPPVHRKATGGGDPGKAEPDQAAG